MQALVKMIPFFAISAGESSTLKREKENEIRSNLEMTILHELYMK